MFFYVVVAVAVGVAVSVAVAVAVAWVVGAAKRARLAVMRFVVPL